jgi:hypothetical protein
LISKQFRQGLYPEGNTSLDAPGTTCNEMRIPCDDCFTASFHEFINPKKK